MGKPCEYEMKCCPCLRAFEFALPQTGNEKMNSREVCGADAPFARNCHGEASAMHTKAEIFGESRLLLLHILD